MNGFFQTNVMTLQTATGELIAQHLPVQKDDVNIPWDMMVQGMIPVDLYDLYSMNWTTPVPVRGQYLVDEQDGTRYSVYGEPTVYVDHIELRVTRTP